MEHGLQIGRFRVCRDGGHWVVVDSDGAISTHETRWNAMKAAKRYCWQAHIQKARRSRGTRERRAGTNPSGEFDPYRSER